jgi:putative acyl-CoA dehydrogenase
MFAGERTQPMRSDEVLNQSPPYLDVDLYASDQALQGAVAANGGAGEAAALSAFGKRWGSAEMFDLARQANENPPNAPDARAFAATSSSSTGLPSFHGRERGGVFAASTGARMRRRGARAGRPRASVAAQIETGHLPDHGARRGGALAAEPALVEAHAQKS